MRFKLQMPALLAILLIGFASCKKEGSDMTHSGYKVIHHVSKGGTKPKVGDFARIQTTVMMDDSTMYSTYDLEYMPPMNIMADSLRTKQSKPLMEAIEMMSVGDSLTLFIPLDSLENVPIEFKKHKHIIHHIVLNAILDQATFDKEMAEQQQKRESVGKALQAQEAAMKEMVGKTLKDYKSGALTGIKNFNVTLDSAKNSKAVLKMYVMEEGKGDNPGLGAMVRVHYYGVLPSGEMFDNSYKAGRPYEFPLGVGKVIRGWDEGIARLKPGAKAFLFIPYEMGYGEAGSPSSDPAQVGIPPKSELIFYVELEKVYK
ncbi:MAG: FKBP-type peptidyl-prolyl cis-trans isomerase [Saprospiraceae bacterium]